MHRPSPQVAHARARIAGKRRQNPDADVTDLRRDLSAARTADRIRSEIRSVDDVDAWADSLAAALEPLTSDEAAAVGRLAATLDARQAISPGEVAA